VIDSFEIFDIHKDLDQELNLAESSENPDILEDIKNYEENMSLSESSSSANDENQEWDYEIL